MNRLALLETSAPGDRDGSLAVVGLEDPARRIRRPRVA